MKPYNENSRCSKCGSSDVSSRYTSEWEYTDYLDIKRIVRVCRRCQYRWAELPLDKEGVEE
jgi:hypothetical protein